MAGQSFSITRGPTTLTASAVQPGREALDLVGMPGLRFDFNARAIFAAGSGVALVIVVETSMTNDDNPQNWETLVTFSSASSSNTGLVESATTGVLRYLRWNATISGTGASFTFEVLGMAW